MLCFIFIKGFFSLISNFQWLITLPNIQHDGCHFILPCIDWVYLANCLFLFIWLLFILLLLLLWHWPERQTVVKGMLCTRLKVSLMFQFSTLLGFCQWNKHYCYVKPSHLLTLICVCVWGSGLFSNNLCFSCNVAEHPSPPLNHWEHQPCLSLAFSQISVVETCNIFLFDVWSVLYDRVGCVKRCMLLLDNMKRNLQMYYLEVPWNIFILKFLGKSNQQKSDMFHYVGTTYEILLLFSFLL